MRNRVYGGLAVLLGVVSTAAAVHAQGPGGPGLGSGGLTDREGLPGLPYDNNPLTAPLGNPGGYGVYAWAQGVLFTDTWTLGNQVVAVRGFRDTSGAITHVIPGDTARPGAFIGSGEVALTTAQFGRRTYEPGIEGGIGYKTEDGTAIFFRIMALRKQSYNAGASLVPDFAATNVSPNLAETFLFSPVFNFNPRFAGPLRKTALDGAFIPATAPTPGNPAGVPATTLPTGLLYGIWNGASNEVISYEKSYNEAEIGGRIPLFQTEYSRIYGMTGGRYHFFMERFRWLATSYDVDGFADPTSTAVYDASLSQRMYGPYVGCGHELYLGKSFSLAGEVQAAALLDFVKERAKYRLSDRSISNKRSINEVNFVPYAAADVNVNWFPVSGIQLRLGYSAQTFFNTKQMTDPIGFNYGAIDPAFENRAFRLVHGLNFGVGVFF